MHSCDTCARLDSVFAGDDTPDGWRFEDGLYVCPACQGELEMEEMRTISHPMGDLLFQYCREYQSLRDENLDLPNVEFHRRFGLSVHAPQSWPTVRIGAALWERVKNTMPKLVLIFSSTSSYQELHKYFGDSVEYCSWYEIYTAMQMSGSDVRHIHRTKKILSDASLVIFFDPPSAVSEVVDQVRSCVLGCLLLIAQGI